ncbi:MAG: YidC/Oxa1 family membrane protein insertase, partial [bacterium]|nr:YidC/Oxa1 family membrane protein insertase [bacterium]
QDVKPHMDKISAKHKKDPKKLQQEQMRLYKEFGINPASGCLFMIIQIPIFISLYNTLSLVLTNGSGAKMIESINKVLYSPALHIDKIDPWFLGLNLALSPAKAGVWYYYALPVITAVLQFLQAKTTMMPGAPPAVVENKDIKKDGDKKEKHSGDDFQKAMNTQMKFIFPLMIGYFSYTLPAGLSLYWNIFSLFSIMQYRQLKAAKK